MMTMILCVGFICIALIEFMIAGKTLLGNNIICLWSIFKMYKTHLVKTFNLFTLNKEAFCSNQDVTMLLPKASLF